MTAVRNNWFAKLMGFREESYESARTRLVVNGDELVSKTNSERYGIGELSLPTLAELRGRVEISTNRHSTVRCVSGEARAMHADPELEGALFQVASQFNLLGYPIQRRPDPGTGLCHCGRSCDHLSELFRSCRR